MSDKATAEPVVTGKLEFGKGQSQVDYSIVNEPMPTDVKTANDQLEEVINLRRELKRQALQTEAKMKHFISIDKALEARRDALLKIR